MPLESCPVCGYALSVHDHHCRHCAVSLSAPPLSWLFDAKHLSTMIVVAVLVLSVLTYLMFFR
jgi:hypothetical protein